MDDVPHVEMLNLAEHFQDIQGTCFLYSARNESHNRSFLWAYPFDEIKVTHSSVLRLLHGRTKQLHSSNPWHDIEKFVSLGFEEKDSISCFFSYEMAFIGDLFDLYVPQVPESLPDAYVQRCGLEIIYEHEKNVLFVTVKDTLPENLFEKIDEAWITERLKNRPLSKEISSQYTEESKEDMHSFCKKVEQIQELIRDGVVYQVNLSHEMKVRGTFSPFGIFRRLCKKNPSSFFAFFRVNDYALVSSSPERFLSKKGDVLETRPIKGTRPKSQCPIENARTRHELRTSEKEVSELMMICDLMRNDLAMISFPGTTCVTDLIRQEEYSHIFHQLSVIQSKPKPLHPIDMLKKIFPGGSISGCPKRESLKTIHALEKRRRGLYTGSIGYIDANGDFDFNIAIRTLVIANDVLTFGVGSGIVIDSDPSQEYLETLHKAQAIMESLHP